MEGIEDWEDHEETLDRVFFGRWSVVKRGSQEHKEFWEFFRRYQTFQKRKRTKLKPKKDPGRGPGKLGLPQIYDKRYRINFSILDSDLSRKLKDYRSHGDRRRRDREKIDYGGLNEEKIEEFRSVLKHFLNFCQKQKFDKLVKIKQAQANLPIRQYREQIVEAVRKNQVIIIAGDTGCGKSTQVPQYLMAAGYKKIGCTQPRRIACISLAKRVGHETLNEYGSEIGFQVRFEASKAADTRIIFLTEGLLLRQLSSDPGLSRYDVIVVDEVHERHVHTDFLLGVLRHLVISREDLKVILMSATINISLFAGYFQDAPVIQVPGRLYPIQLDYMPVQQASLAGSNEQSKPGRASAPEKIDTSHYLRIMQRIDHKYPVSERGDLLVFLSGMKEISALVDEARLYAMHTKRWIVLPLHSALSIQEQDKVFDVAPDGVRKCIVSTNIAETSITIDGVRFIVDSGKVKEMGYDSTSKMRRLQEFWISKASAEQRKGRAGRTGPGVCFRLYSDQDYDAFQDYSTPEIQRVPLDTLILQLIDLDMGDPRSFAFIEPPPLSSVNNSIHFLKNQSALTKDEQLTPIGRMLAKLPVDVVIGKMLVMGSMFDMVDPVLTIAAALSVQSPFHRLLRAGESDVQVKRRELESDHGDALTLMNAFDTWVELKTDGRSSTRKWCKRYGLEDQRFYEMAKLKDQFKEILEEYKLLEKDYQSGEESSSKRKKDEESTYAGRQKRRELRELRRRHRKEPRRRKVLKMEDAEEESEEEGKDELDIKDLEFKLSHDLDKLQAASNFYRSLTLRDINLLKVILCSGLYPQLAVADDCNTWRKESEQVFHTLAKPFVVLHPTSVFANQPDVLQTRMGVAEGVTAMGQRDKLRFSMKHELLAYVDLLETTKPFLVSNLRVPALQTLLLFAQNLDTNEDCRRIIVDGWLELVIPEAHIAQKLIAAAQQLRSTWNRLLELRLQRVEGSKGSVELYHAMDHASTLERTLARKLSEFLDSEVSYSFRRLAAAELERLYISTKDKQEGGDDLSSSCVSHPTKGGQVVTDYLTYNCLSASSAVFESDYGGALMKHWNCPRCNKSMVVTIAERLKHADECRKQEDQASLEKKIEEGGGPASSTSAQRVAEELRKTFFCDKCQENFMFTMTEVLKHVRKHEKKA